MPKLVSFPGCCTARILAGFGGTDTGDWGYRPQGNKMKEGELFAYLARNLSGWKRMGSIAIIFATTNTDQKQAAAELKAFGFIPTPQVGKKQHPNVDLIGWHYVVGEDKGAPVVKEFKVPKEKKEVEANPPAVPKFRVEAPVVPAAPIPVVNEELWHNPLKFKVGDRVKVLSRAPSLTRGWSNSWVDGMGSTIGEIFEVQSSPIVGREGFRLSSGFYYPSFVLQKVQKRDEKGRFTR